MGSFVTEPRKPARGSRARSLAAAAALAARRRRLRDAQTDGTAAAAPGAANRRQVLALAGGDRLLGAGFQRLGAPLGLPPRRGGIPPLRRAVPLWRRRRGGRPLPLLSGAPREPIDAHARLQPDARLAAARGGSAPGPPGELGPLRFRGGGSGRRGGARPGLPPRELRHHGHDATRADARAVPGIPLARGGVQTVRARNSTTSGWTRRAST